jgi:hypothetical protein
MRNIKRELASYESTPANLDELWTCVQTERENLTSGQYYNLVASMSEVTSNNSDKRELY